MDGITDAPMRAYQGETGAFTFVVSEFLRVSQEVPPKRLFWRHVPELLCGGTTPTGLPVQVQILGGDPGRMAAAAVIACRAGARGIDINFGCPAPTVNRHDGGATLLKFPQRIREIVAAVRTAVPAEVPVSAKLRLGWDTTDSIYENAEMAAEGGADWLTIHARTRLQGYAPPVCWPSIGGVRERLKLPIVANGDIWTLDDFRRCRDETGCRHFMIGRGALANPRLARQIACELGIVSGRPDSDTGAPIDWIPILKRFVEVTRQFDENLVPHSLRRLKQWLSLAGRHGDFQHFDAVKRAPSLEAFVAILCELGTQKA